MRLCLLPALANPEDFDVAAMRLVSLLAFAHVGGVFGLWPLPRPSETGSSPLKLASHFDIHSNIQHAPSDLSDAISRTKSALKNDKLGRLVVGRGASDSSAVQHAKSLTSLQLSLAGTAPVQSITEESMLEIGRRKEEYVLNVPADGSAATLRVSSMLRLLRV